MSVTYGAGLAVLAVAPMPVGIDVEASGPAPAGFADRAAWTRAEAALKLTGDGVRRDPWAPLPAGVRWTPLDGLPSGHVGTVATWDHDGPTVVEVRGAPATSLETTARLRWFRGSGLGGLRTSTTVGR